MSGAPARLAAGQIVMAVLEERRTLDDALGQTSSFTDLQGPDRGFARAMASAALRQLGRINTGLAPFLNRPLQDLDPAARALLQIGAAQLWLMDTPAHAAVGETVAAAKLWPAAARAAGLLNAVLRKVASDRAGFDASPPLQIWPDWLQQAMIEGVGQATAETLAHLQMSEPDLHLSCKPGELARTLEAFAAAGIAAEALPSGSLKTASGAVEALPLYDEGVWWVQDAAAALPASLVGARPGDAIVDLCAAPGGKTMQLAATGADVFAVDRSAKRLSRVRDNLDRTGLGAHVKTIAEKGEVWRTQTPIDAVLVDAPCSAFGTLRRHPEGARIKQANDVARFPDIQTRLLTAALEMVKPGGTVVYCVCSPLPAEGERVVNAVLEDERYQRRAVMPEEVPGFVEAITSHGDVLTLPGGAIQHDAFFVSRLTRTA